MTNDQPAPSHGTAREVIRQHADDLLSYLQRRVDSREDAADLLGETMLQAWRRLDSLPIDSQRQRMWLFTIAANVLANHRRSHTRKLALVDRLRHHLSPADIDPDLAEAHAVRDAVLRLRPAQRELVMLVHWDGFTLLEAAELLGVNQSTARSRYSAAWANLRAALNEGARIQTALSGEDVTCALLRHRVPPQLHRRAFPWLETLFTRLGAIHIGMLCCLSEVRQWRGWEQATARWTAERSPGGSSGDRASRRGRHAHSRRAVGPDAR